MQLAALEGQHKNSNNHNFFFSGQRMEYGENKSALTINSEPPMQCYCWTEGFKLKILIFIVHYNKSCNSSTVPITEG